MKKSLFIIIPLVLLIVVGGLVFAQKISNKSTKTAPTPTPEETNVEKIPTDSLIVVFTPRDDKKAFTLTVKNLKDKGYKQFEYEISYDAQSAEDPTQIITQGSASKEPVQVTNQDFTREILLGTCSKNVCKYDQGVNLVKVTLRLTTTNNKTKIWEKEFSLE